VLALAALLANDHGSILSWDGVNGSHFFVPGQPPLVPKTWPAADLTEVAKLYKNFSDLDGMGFLFMEISRAPSQRPWLTAKEAADYLGVTPVTLYSYVKLRKNKPPCFRLAGKPRGVLRFPKEEFIRWANGSTKQEPANV